MLIYFDIYLDSNSINSSNSTGDSSSIHTHITPTNDNIKNHNGESNSNGDSNSIHTHLIPTNNNI